MDIGEIIFIAIAILIAFINWLVKDSGFFGGSKDAQQKREELLEQLRRRQLARKSRGRSPAAPAAQSPTPRVQHHSPTAQSDLPRVQRHSPTAQSHPPTIQRHSPTAQRPQPQELSNEERVQEGMRRLMEALGQPMESPHRDAPTPSLVIRTSPSARASESSQWQDKQEKIEEHESYDGFEEDEEEAFIPAKREKAFLFPQGQDEKTDKPYQLKPLAPTTTSMLAKEFHSVEALRKAIVMREVLGPPKAFALPSERWF